MDRQKWKREIFAKEDFTDAGILSFRETAKVAS